MSLGPPAPLPLGRPVRRHIGRRALAVAPLVLACLWLGVRHQVRYYAVTSGSMEPTLTIGERVTIDPNARTPQVGDIVVFHPPAGADPATPICGLSGQGALYTQACGVSTTTESSAAFVKRVVAGPGNTIALVGGRVVRDGAAQSEPYVEPCVDGSICNFPTPITLSAGEYYMLGDNRGASDDSRFWGPIPQAWIIGTVVRCSVLKVVCHPLR